VGRLSKGCSISPSWSPHFRGTPVVESQTTRGFLRRYPEPHSGKTLTIYEYLQFMKPTPQIPNNTGFPLTDCNYQPTADANIAGGRSLAKLTNLHKLSSDFIGREMVRDFAVEFSAFTVIGVISAWPICLSIMAMARMLWS
jgi:hypothetical protein